MFGNDVKDIMEMDSAELFDLLPVGVAIIDSTSRQILAINHTAVEMCGFSKEELLGKACNHFLCPTDGGKCPILDLGSKVDRSERRMLRKDAPTLPILKSVIPVIFKGKTALLEVMLDLSEQQNLMRTIFKTIPDLIFVKDLNGVYTLSNPAFERVLEVAEKDLIGKTDYELFDSEMAKLFSEKDLEVQNSRRPESHEDHIQYTRGGTAFWLETTKVPVLNNEGEPIATLGICHDITKRKDDAMRIERNSKVQMSLRKIVEATLTNTPLNDFYRQLSDIIAELFPKTSFFISLIDEEAGTLYVPFIVDLSGVIPQTRPLGKGFREYVLSKGEAVLLHPKDIDELSALGILDKNLLDTTLPFQSQWIGCPLFEKSGKAIGVAALFAIGDEYIFTEPDKEVFSVAAANISLTLERIKAEINLKESYEKLWLAREGTIRILSNTAEVKDAYTAGHQRKVAELTCAIAQKMGYSESEFQQTIRMAALIHDIGKISIPSEILSKPGVLLPLEFELIKLHSQVGYDLLRDEAMSGDIADIIHQHHERLDGSGYPNGLKADEIRFEAKIIAVADVIEAMSSFRPYRPSLGMNVAVEEIQKNAGILYDAEVVSACAEIITDGSFHFSE